MRYLQTSEESIRNLGPRVLSIYLHLKARNPNSIIYPNKVNAARKLGIDRSTLSRWIACLLTHKLAIRRTTGHIVLATIDQAKQIAGGSCKHRCTIIVSPTDTRENVEEQLRYKLLEEQHRRVLYKHRETKIDHRMQEVYGVIHNDRIRRKYRKEVKSRIDMIPQVGAPMSAKSISEKLGISERKWYRLSNKWKSNGMIDSFRQEESLDLWMTKQEYQAAREHFGFATKRKRTGEVLRVRPNLIHINADYTIKETRNAMTPTGGPASAPYIVFTAMLVDGRMVYDYPVVRLPQDNGHPPVGVIK